MAGDLPQESEGTSIKTVLEIRGHPSQLDITYQQTLSDDQVEIGVDPVHYTLYELVITHGKGYGLFATTSIPRGTRVFTEAPLMTVLSPSKEPGLPTLDNIKDLSDKLDALSTEQHKAYFDLYHDPEAAKLASVQIRRAQELLKHTVLKTSLPNAHKVEAMAKLHAIYQSNVVRLSDDQKCGTGVFALTSRINHSCIPNLQIHYIPSTEQLVAHAVRHINKGEELTISYLSKACRTRKQRNEILERRGFECKCRVCTGTQAIASEERRRRMFWLEFGLALFDEPHEYSQYLDTPQTTQEAVRSAEELIKLLRAEGIADRGLQSAHRRYSKYCLQAGLFDKAVNYAKKERDIEYYCIGVDTAQMSHLETDLKGAEFWLKYVLSEQQSHRAKQKEAEN